MHGDRIYVALNFEPLKTSFALVFSMCSWLFQRCCWYFQWHLSIFCLHTWPYISISYMIIYSMSCYFWYWVLYWLAFFSRCRDDVARQDLPLCEARCFPHQALTCGAMSCSPQARKVMEKTFFFMKQLVKLLLSLLEGVRLLVLANTRSPGFFRFLVPYFMDIQAVISPQFWAARWWVFRIATWWSCLSQVPLDGNQQTCWKAPKSEDMTPLAGVVQHTVQVAQLTLPTQGFFGTRWAAEVGSVISMNIFQVMM